MSIPHQFDPWVELGITSSSSYEARKLAFRKLVKTTNRQQRAIVSIAAHMTFLPDLYGSPRALNVFDCVLCGDTETLKQILCESCNDLHRKDDSGRTLLYLAAKGGFYDTCKFLLKYGVNHGPCGEDNSTPLHVASFYGHEIVCVLLIKHGARLDAKNKWKSTPVSEAANEDTRNAIQKTQEDQINQLIQELDMPIIVRDVFYGHQETQIARVIKINKTFPEWEQTWHGTKMKFVKSILENGLSAPGWNGVEIQPFHIAGGREVYGIPDYATAIFTSHFMLYAGHSAYAQTILDDNKVEFKVIISTLNKPGTYQRFGSTTPGFKPPPGAAPDAPEWRISYTPGDEIARCQSKENVQVTGVVFLRKSTYDKMSKGEIAYDAVVRKILEALN